jgi:hypothetical protein
MDIRYPATATTSRAEIIYPATDIRYPAEEIKPLLPMSTPLIPPEKLTDRALLDMFVDRQETPEDDILQLFPTEEEEKLLKNEENFIVPHTTRQGRNPRTAGAIRRK